MRFTLPRPAIATALAALLGIASAAAADPAATSTGMRLAAGVLDPATHDFGQDRYAPGQTPLFLAEKSLAETAVAKAHGKPTIQAVRAARVCLSPSEALTLAGYDSALIAPDAAAWRRDKAAADAAYDRYVALRDAVLAGTDVPDPEFKADVAAMKRAAAAPQLEAKALYRRQALDGIWRHALVYAAPRAYAGPISKAAAVWLNARLTLEGCRIERDNAAWLRGELATLPWFDIKTYGKEGDAAAWQLAEHADADPALQTTVLERIGQLALTRQSNPANFAFLWDHVALGSGRPQRYGTQMRCVGKAFVPITPVEEPTKLDERRSWVGLVPSAVAQQAGARVCGG